MPSRQLYAHDAMNWHSYQREWTMALLEASIRLSGRTPLVLHNNQCVDPRNPLKKQIAAITSKGKRRTDADLEQLIKLEFLAGLYINDDLGPYLPSRMLWAMLIGAARKEKNGKQFEAGSFVPNDAPIIYDGPRDWESLFEDNKYVWTTVCGNQKASVLRTRPRFDEWAVEFDVELEDSLVSFGMLESAMQHAQLSGALGDGRSIGFGRFNVESVVAKELV